MLSGLFFGQGGIECSERGERMKKTVKLKPMWLSIVQAVGMMLVFCLAFCAIGAALVVGGVIPQDMIAVAALVCLGLGTVVGCRLALRRESSGKLLFVTIVIGAAAAVFLLGNLIFVPQAPMGWLRVIAALLFGGLLAILTAIQTRKRAGKRR